MSSASFMFVAENGDAFNVGDLTDDVFVVSCSFAVGFLVHLCLCQWARRVEPPGDLKDRQPRAATAPLAGCTHTSAVESLTEPEAFGADRASAGEDAGADAWDAELQLLRPPSFPSDPGRRLLEAYAVLGAAAGTWSGAKEAPLDCLAMIDASSTWPEQHRIPAAFRKSGGEPPPRHAPIGRQLLEEYGVFGAPAGFWAGAH